MSVINKMLRDLDARRAAPALPAGEGPAGMRRGTASVKGRGQSGAGAGTQPWRMTVAMVAVLAAAAMGWWYWHDGSAPVGVPVQVAQVTKPAQVAASAPKPASAASAPVPFTALPVQIAPAVGAQQMNQMLDQAAKTASGDAPTGVPPAPGAPQAGQPVLPGMPPGITPEMMQQLAKTANVGQVNVPSLPPGLAYELKQQLSQAAPSAGSATARAPVQPVAPSAAATSPRTVPAPSRQVMAGSTQAPLFPRPNPVLRPLPGAETLASAAPAPAPLAAEPVSGSPAEREAMPKAATASTRATTTPQPKPAKAAPDPRQAAALETLTQARNLWNAGSREAALDLMRKAVAVAERAHAGGIEPGGRPSFQTLVRELARMELAEGQVSQVLELLVRLEPLLDDQADLWAVRGNAAQRLGQHQESVNAYGMALKLRPGEARWMLASAVSLAVQGQLTAAAEQAEKARAAGAVSPEVLTYLRQLGVPLR